MEKKAKPLDPEAVLGDGGLASRRLPRYEARAEQMTMANAVADAIAEGGHLLVEAGTGVGKSFAYLVPAILAAAEQGKKVVVATHTIALQEQLVEKDLPFLRSILPVEFNAVLVKGRSNYVSLRRLKMAGERAGSLFKSEEADQVIKLTSWAKTTADGSRSDLSFRPFAAVWSEVASEDGNCMGRKCPTYKECFFQAARRRVHEADLLIVNHALYMIDVGLRANGGSFLPPHDVVIFDEAHTLDAVASDHLGLRLSSGSVEFFLNRLAKGLQGPDSDAPTSSKSGTKSPKRPERHGLQSAIVNVSINSNSFFNDVAYVAREFGSRNGRLRQPIDVDNVLGESLNDLAGLLSEEATVATRDDERLELNAAADKCRSLAVSIERWLSQSEAESVFWVETESKPRSKIVLASAPLNLGELLNRDLFQRIPTCILTSATLCSGKPPSFEFARKTLGIPECVEIQLGSPYDYQSQVAIHIARGLPDPSAAAREFEDRAIEAIPYYLDKTQGKAFVLFTSHILMERAARELTPWFQERGIRLLAQSDGMPRSQMVDAFKADVDSVLFGADSFWQGVDVPGEALSNVIIVRIPFSVPDKPLLEARLEKIRADGGNPFTEYQVPEAIIKLKQGFGRLVRSRGDEGIVVLLDPRVLTKPYGRALLDSLPECRRIIETPLRSSAPSPPPSRRSW